MMNTVVKKPHSRILEPVLHKVLFEAEKEHHELQKVFKLMGWNELPEELKIEIKEDIKGYRDELEGNYSTCDPFVMNRRERVDFWVRSYLAGDCCLQTAVAALRVRSL